MISGFKDIFNVPELRRRVLFTMGMLAAYRLGAAIPCPGINPEALRELFNSNTLLGFLDMFSGGALNQMSIFSMGIMPYITASIIMSILQTVWPTLEKISKEGEAGRRKITQITRYATIAIALWQAFGLTMFLTSFPAPTPDVKVVVDPSLPWRLKTMLTMCTGTVVVMWLGELISESGIGNGISLMIFAGIVDRLPSAIKHVWELVRLEELGPVQVLVIVAVAVIVTAAVVWIETGQRRIPIQYGQRMIGRKVYGGQSSFLPIRVDLSGVIAVIFAITLLQIPAALGTFFPDVAFLQWAQGFWRGQSFLWEMIYAALIIFFCYFYNSIVLNPNDIAENLKKSGGSIPGIRAGDPTAKYISWVVERITLGGAIFVALIAIMPDYLRKFMKVPFMFGGTSLLIAVGVALDTVGQLESHLIMRQYEGLVKGTRIKGRWFNVK